MIWRSISIIMVELLVKSSVCTLSDSKIHIIHMYVHTYIGPGYARTACRFGQPDVCAVARDAAHTQGAGEQKDSDRCRHGSAQSLPL